MAFSSARVRGMDGVGDTAGAVVIGTVADGADVIGIVAVGVVAGLMAAVGLMAEEASTVAAGEAASSAVEMVFAAVMDSAVA